MKLVSLFILLCILKCTAFAQLQRGFEPQEAKEMIALCNSYSYLELYNDDRAIIPKGYSKIYSSPVKGMDNKFQVYTKGSIGVINFRGSTAKKSSWMENLHSALIPVDDTIKIQEKIFFYKFGEDTASGVHCGFALGLAYLHEELIEQINALNKNGIKNIILTGHSQGGAIALLTRAYLEYSTNGILSKENKYKVYTFGQPMIGNIEFVREYNTKFCSNEMSFSMINSADVVPKMPLSYNDSTFLRDNLIDLLSKEKEFDRNQMLKDGLMILFEKKLNAMAEKFGQSVNKQIERELGNIELPNPKNEINYSQICNIIMLPPPDYPLELKDSSLLNDSTFLATHPKDQNGIFQDKSVYKKTPMSLNHKPYNYYTSVLKVYFPKEYEKVDPKLF